VEHDKATVLNHSSDAHHRARMSAIISDHSSDWLFALPIASCGLRLSNDAVRIAVGIRLGANICVPHIARVVLPWIAVACMVCHASLHLAVSHDTVL
jgi:hypothetical protein